MNNADWVAVAIVALAALNGLRRGLIAGALSLAGLAGGAYAGSGLAPPPLPGGRLAAGGARRRRVRGLEARPAALLGRRLALHAADRARRGGRARRDPPVGRRGRRRGGSGGPLPS